MTRIGLVPAKWPASCSLIQTLNNLSACWSWYKITQPMPRLSLADILNYTKKRPDIQPGRFCKFFLKSSYLASAVKRCSIFATRFSSSVTFSISAFLVNVFLSSIISALIESNSSSIRDKY